MGIIKTGIALAVICTAFYSGYNLNEKSDYRFDVEKKGNAYYLLDKKEKRSKEITNNFELGTAEERLNSLLQEDNLKKSLESAIQNKGQLNKTRR